MVWEMQKSSGFDLSPDCCKGGVCCCGVSKVFDEMATSDLRSPSHILEVTIHQVHCPITGKVLRQVFSPFGVVEEMDLYEGLKVVVALVAFQSKHEAAEAYGALHGRNIYDGCCQMEIKWGFSQVPDVSMVTSKGDTAASSSSTRFPSATASMPALNELGSEKLPMKADASGAHTEAASLAAAVSGNIIADLLVTVSDVVDRNIDGELQMPAAATIAEELGPNLVAVASSVSILDTAPTSPSTSLLLDNITWNPTATSPVSLVHASLGAHQLFEEMLACSTVLYIHGTTLVCIDPGDEYSMVLLWPWPVTKIGQQAWPPPLLLLMFSDSPTLCPTSWPSFQMFDSDSVSWFSGWNWKIPWSHFIPRTIRCVFVERIHSVGHMVVISMSSRLGCESNGWSLMRICHYNIAGEICGSNALVLTETYPQ